MGYGFSFTEKKIWFGDNVKAKTKIEIVP